MQDSRLIEIIDLEKYLVATDLEYSEVVLFVWVVGMAEVVVDSNWAAGRMNPANRQPSGNLGDLGVVAGQHIELQLGCGFRGQAGVLLSKPGPLRLAAAINPPPVLSGNLASAPLGRGYF